MCSVCAFGRELPRFSPWAPAPGSVLLLSESRFLSGISLILLCCKPWSLPEQEFAGLSSAGAAEPSRNFSGILQSWEKIAFGRVFSEKPTCFSISAPGWICASLLSQIRVLGALGCSPELLPCCFPCRNVSSVACGSSPGVIPSLPSPGVPWTGSAALPWPPPRLVPPEFIPFSPPECFPSRVLSWMCGCGSGKLQLRAGKFHFLNRTRGI